LNIEKLSFSGEGLIGNLAKSETKQESPASDSLGLGLSIAQQIYRYYGFTLRYKFSPLVANHTLSVDFLPEP
jgi:hypothetical protein